MVNTFEGMLAAERGEAGLSVAPQTTGFSDIQDEIEMEQLPSPDGCHSGRKPYVVVDEQWADTFLPVQSKTPRFKPSSVKPSTTFPTNPKLTTTDRRGPRGLAYLKTEDERFSLYRYFENPRSFILDYLSRGIQQRWAAIQKLEDSSRSSGLELHSSFRTRGMYGKEMKRHIKRIYADLKYQGALAPLFL